MTAPPLPASPSPPPSLRQLQPLVPALPLTEGQGATPAGRRPVDLVMAIAHAPLLRDIAAVLL
ncbi:MAG TPA: hypothetical protein VHS99_27735, partial [Chloroflexota bacterium]|nr:hypothetical protein [Chloroflexota bacterium]